MEWKLGVSQTRLPPGVLPAQEAALGTIPCNDAYGNRLTVKDANLHTTAFDYDSLDRLTDSPILPMARAPETISKVGTLSKALWNLHSSVTMV
jgi:hypothetical protein